MIRMLEAFVSRERGVGAFMGRKEDKGESRLNGVEQMFTPGLSFPRVLSDTTRCVGGQVFQPPLPACETSSFGVLEERARGHVREIIESRRLAPSSVSFNITFRTFRTF